MYLYSIVTATTCFYFDVRSTSRHFIASQGGTVSTSSSQYHSAQAYIDVYFKYQSRLDLCFLKAQ